MENEYKHELLTPTNKTLYFKTREELLDAFASTIKIGEKFWVGTSSDNAVSIYIDKCPGVNFDYIKAVKNIVDAKKQAKDQMLTF